MTEKDLSVTARRWPTKLTPAEREQAILDVLTRLGGWVAPGTVQRILRDHGQKLAPGTARAILDRLADAGRCERQRTGGTSATFRAVEKP